MGTIIFLIIAVLFIVLIKWTWNSLGNIEKTKKIQYIIIGLVITWIITFIIYNISKIGIHYENETVMKTLQKVYVLVFTIVNGYIFLPFIFRTLEKINNNEIEKENFQKKMLVLIIVFIIIAIFECKYLANTQIGTLEILGKRETGTSLISL